MSVVRSSEVPLLGGSKCTSSMGKSIGGRKICPLYRGCPLFGESAIRGFTVFSVPHVVQWFKQAGKKGTIPNSMKLQWYSGTVVQMC